MCGNYKAIGNLTGYDTCWNTTSIGDHPIPPYAVKQFNQEKREMQEMLISCPSVVSYQVLACCSEVANAAFDAFDGLKYHSISS